MDPVVDYVRMCVQNRFESLGLKAMKDFDAGIGGCPPLLNDIIPDGSEYCFLWEEFFR
jgi:hypothetical protein